MKSEGWITADGVFAPEHDAANVHWGGGWRMPTRKELCDINDKCDWTWTMKNGVFGYLVCGRGDYASASIFLPAAGHGNGTSLNGVGWDGYFWSSVYHLDILDYAWGLYFHSYYYSSGYDTVSGRSRYLGQSVRPVQEFTE